MRRRAWGERTQLPHIARQLGHDVAMPRGTASMRNLSQRPTEASSRPVTPDRRKVGLEVSSIDSVTLSDGESRENAHTPADMVPDSAPSVSRQCRTRMVDLEPTQAVVCVHGGDISVAAEPVLCISAQQARIVCGRLLHTILLRHVQRPEGTLVIRRPGMQTDCHREADGAGPVLFSGALASIYGRYRDRLGCSNFGWSSACGRGWIYGSSARGSAPW
jgi:hypothetical protein